MAVYKRGYRRYSGPLTGRWARFMVLPRNAWRRLYRQREVLLLCRDGSAGEQKEGGEQAAWGARVHRYLRQSSDLNQYRWLDGRNVSASWASIQAAR